MKKSKALSRTVWLAIIAIVIILVAALSAWYLMQPTDEETELTVFSLWSDQEEANFKEALARFTENTGIEVNHVAYSTTELLVTVPTQLEAGEAIADVIIAPWPSWILDLAEDGLLADVSDYMDTTKLPETYLDVVSSGDAIYAAPFKVSGKPGFWYRESFFADNGLTAPTTYEEFKTLLADLSEIEGVEAAIASGNGTGWPLSDTTEAFIIGLGGYQLQENLISGATAFTSSETKAVFEELADLLQADYFSVPDDWQTQLQRLYDGTYGIYFQGGFVTTISPFSENLDDIGFFPFPETDGATGSVDYAVMPAATKNMEEAQQLIEFLAGAEAQEIMVQQGGFLAANSDVPESAYNPADLQVVQFMQTVTIVPDLDDAIGNPFQQAFWDQLKAFWVNPTLNLDTMLQTLQDEWAAS
ncbi:MAG TPA: carbohydrate ABC transporter substrate-binding protein [Candidatus Bathyarchaeota archaeon]|nr:carbohydrate ABC transporter substrate-binding protein [Candidatus Bathyarchaeota archaeon]